jgi:FMN phosphatase YigB (HAD superfamily)
MARIEQVIFDVDDVMVDTDAATRAAADSVESVLGAKVSRAFQKSYEVLIRNLRGESAPEYPALRKRIEGWQRELKEVKQWSRECLLAIALEDAGETPTFAKVEAAARVYWRTLTEKTVVYPDAAEMARRLAADGIGVHLATNSDGFLKLDEPRGTFIYDPADSARRKKDRLHMLGPLPITVGDPVGKPLPGFYAQVLQDLGRKVEMSRVLAVGDSLTADVLPFVKLGAQGVWLKRHGPLESAEVPVVRSLLELERYVW